MSLHAGSIKLARVRRPSSRARGAFWWRYDFVESTLTVVAAAGAGGGARGVDAAAVGDAGESRCGV